MSRRNFIYSLLISMLVVSPLAAQQRATVPNIGILNYATDNDIRVRQFLHALWPAASIHAVPPILTVDRTNRER